MNEWTGRVGQSWAREWERTDRSFGRVTDRLVEDSLAAAYRTALDIGCGAGEITLRLAKASPSSRHNGVDISSELASVAQERLGGLANARAECLDVQHWNPEQADRPDLLVSRHGVMFFEEPAAAFAHLRDLALPGARLVFSCFRPRSENGWATTLADAVKPGETPADTGGPGPFAFGDRAYVEKVLGEAGWRSVEFEPLDYSMLAGTGENPVADAMSYFRTIGPAARPLAEMDGAERSNALARLEALLERHHTAGQVSLPAASWIVSARNPA